MEGSLSEPDENLISKLKILSPNSTNFFGLEIKLMYDFFLSIFNISQTEHFLSQIKVVW